MRERGERGWREGLRKEGRKGETDEGWGGEGENGRRRGRGLEDR